jgi:hypothetical protein
MGTMFKLFVCKRFKTDILKISLLVKKYKAVKKSQEWI